MKILGRNPVLALSAVNAAIMLVGTFGFGWFTGEQAGLLVAVVNAIGGIAAAVLVRPIAPAAFTAFITAAVALLAAYQVNIPGETLAALNALVTPVLAFLTYGNVSPIDSRFTKTTDAPTVEAAEYNLAKNGGVPFIDDPNHSADDN